MVGPSVASEVHRGALLAALVDSAASWPVAPTHLGTGMVSPGMPLPSARAGGETHADTRAHGQTTKQGKNHQDHSSVGQ